MASDGFPFHVRKTRLGLPEELSSRQNVWNKDQLRSLCSGIFDRRRTLMDNHMAAEEDLTGDATSSPSRVP